VLFYAQSSITFWFLSAFGKFLFTLYLLASVHCRLDNSWNMAFAVGENLKLSLTGLAALSAIRSTAIIYLAFGKFFFTSHFLASVLCRPEKSRRVAFAVGENLKLLLAGLQNNR
jgi:hypothetical protein